MHYNNLLVIDNSITFAQEDSIITILIIISIFFLILLILGVRKSYKLKAENERLSQTSPCLKSKNKDSGRAYIGSHLYNHND